MPIATTNAAPASSLAFQFPLAPSTADPATPPPVMARAAEDPDTAVRAVVTAAVITR